MKLLITGGRDFFNDKLVANTLDLIHSASTITELIHGGASGADTLAGCWATANGIPVKCFSADWMQNGKAAGPIRNSQMLAEKPDVLVAFPGGKGTADMVAKAKHAGVNVVEVIENGEGLKGEQQHRPPTRT